MKPSLGLDEQTLRQKNLKHYLHRMKKNKYWKMGYDAAKKKKGKDSDPYRPIGKLLEQLIKHTYWVLGYEERTAVPYRLERMKKEEVKAIEKDKLHKKKLKLERKKHGKHRH